MPIYDFKCRDCGKVSEILVRSTDSNTAQCSGCGSADMEKLISAPYMMRTNTSEPGTTCCGSAERCDSPPCSTGDTCHRA